MTHHPSPDQSAGSNDLVKVPPSTPLHPDEFDWIPVERKRRADGWTVERQRLFIETLAATGSVKLASIEVDMSTVSCYRLRNAPDGRGFATAWDIAINAAARQLTDVALERVMHGSEEPVFDRDGNRTGRRVRYNDRLLMFMLRAMQPERFGNGTPASSVPPPATIDTALQMLAPAPPATVVTRDMLLKAPAPTFEDEPDFGLSDEYEAQLEAIKNQNQGYSTPYWQT